ncbi:MAG TPA: tetraacyldisaccharide 4'-kinase [Gammaproteobacteria bacterium]|nr:tetraacyldisaccharide 4'-kinase [Gammaproteobacteria bacterium]
MSLSLESIWYRRHPVGLLLLPLSWVFFLVVVLRRFCYRTGVLKQHKIACPVIIVGNITVGGTGKTPLVIWLIAFLKKQGYHPGIISRGYGGHASTWPQQVRPDSDPYMVGDEPVLMAQRCQCPVAVGPDRVGTAQALLEHNQCDIIVSDDGLQHYALARDIEFVVIDGIRRFGNNRCLPSGPLREPVSRLREADFLVVNGLANRGEHAMELTGTRLINMLDDRQTRELSDWSGKRVHAVAGIGNPKRFFTTLNRAGLDLESHAFRDHYEYNQRDLDFTGDNPVIMTEKDKVKCLRFANRNFWYLPVDAQIDERLETPLLRKLNALNKQR